ncbi:MAG: N-methyl-L-tryptophan oxidase [Hyphomicrobiales bacterium]|nr:N-methyl-L-tryptophan oxidase [Alphaproteobacteria bacterium]
MKQFDVVVVGLGVMGAAALRELARRGFNVVGVERFMPGHDRGSSHGETRIIRLGYFEHPSYVPLLQRSYELWRELEADSGRKLIRITGIVEIGMPVGPLISGTLAAARQHNLAHDILDGAEVMRRFPVFRIPSDYVGVWQPDGGFAAAEATVEALIELATAAKAKIRSNVSVLSIEPHGHGVLVRTSVGDIEARTAIVAAGPWLPTLIPNLPAPLRATREVMAWFKPRDPAPFVPSRLPVFILESRHGMHYGFPVSRAGHVKIAKHHHRNETVNPDDPRRLVSEVDEDLIRSVLKSHIPAANGPLAAATTCFYTMTPDHDFIIDRLPGAPNVIVASPCSGHGFKFAPVVGEILADLAIDGGTGHDISRFRFDRFG